MSEKNEAAWQITIVAAVNLIILILIISMSKSEAYAMGLGNSGERVCAVQRSLKSKGFYSGEISGIYDFATRKSIRSFQKASGLEVNGEADYKTVSALEINSENKIFSYETEVLARYAQWVCGGKGYTYMLDFCRKTLSDIGKNATIGSKIIKNNPDFSRKLIEIEPSTQTVRAAVTALYEPKI